MLIGFVVARSRYAAGGTSSPSSESSAPIITSLAPPCEACLAPFPLCFSLCLRIALATISAHESIVAYKFSAASSACSVVPLVITEINARPLNLFGKDGETWERLSGINRDPNRDISVLLQPADILAKFKKQLKSLRGYKDFLLG